MNVPLPSVTRPPGMAVTKAPTPGNDYATWTPLAKRPCNGILFCISSIAMRGSGSLAVVCYPRVC